jgi:hypothetical protein
MFRERKTVTDSRQIKLTEENINEEERKKAAGHKQFFFPFSFYHFELRCMLYENKDQRANTAGERKGNILSHPLSKVR